MRSRRLHVLLIVSLWACSVAAQDGLFSDQRSPGEGRISGNYVSLPSMSRDIARIRTISQTLSDEIPLVIAHRGASGYLPEHSTEAVSFAHALGADFIEQDVVMSRDGVVMVMHDVTLDDVTDVANAFPGRQRDGRFYAWDFTEAELKQLKVRERFPVEGKSGAWHRFPKSSGTFRFATFEEHIQLIQGLNHTRRRNTGLYVELKHPDQHHAQGLDLAKAVLHILKKYGYSAAEHRAIVETFDEREVLRIRTELDCRLPLVQLLLETPTEEKLNEISRIADGIGVPVTSVVTGASAEDPPVPVISSLVKDAHERALMVHVWTYRVDALPDFVADPQRLLSWLIRDAGVDGIFADQPDVLVDWRAANQHVRRHGPFRLLNSGRDAD